MFFRMTLVSSAIFVTGCGSRTGLQGPDIGDAATVTPVTPVMAGDAMAPTMGSGRACPVAPPQAGASCEPSCSDCAGAHCDYLNLDCPVAARCESGRWVTRDCFTILHR